MPQPFTYIQPDTVRYIMQDNSDPALNTENHYVEATLQWVDDIVIAHNFCPFAKYVRTPNKIRCEEINGEAGEILETLYDEMLHLDNNEATATTLLVLTHPSLARFDEYLDILAISEKMLQDWGFSGRYQLASFHPNYIFEGSSSEDSENYTNRSPYPLFHLIRERDISQYMKNEEDAEKIFNQNIEKANTLGCPYFESQLDRLRSKHKKSPFN